eukprot:161919_1
MSSKATIQLQLTFTCLLVFITLSADPPTTIVANHVNCNVLYLQNTSLASGNKIGSLFIQDYFEMEFNLHLDPVDPEECTAGSNHWIFHITGTDDYNGTHTPRYDDMDRFPLLLIYACNQWRYRWSDDAKRNHLPPGATSTTPTITYPGDYHIYASFTPTEATFNMNGYNRIWNATSRSKYFGTEWSIWAGIWQPGTVADGYLSNICIRSWSAGSYTGQPTKQPTTAPTKYPTREPSQRTKQPSTAPTKQPSTVFGTNPSNDPSSSPTNDSFTSSIAVYHGHDTWTPTTTTYEQITDNVIEVRNLFGLSETDFLVTVIATGVVCCMCIICSGGIAMYVMHNTELRKQTHVPDKDAIQTIPMTYQHNTMEQTRTNTVLINPVYMDEHVSDERDEDQLMETHSSDDDDDVLVEGDMGTTVPIADDYKEDVDDMHGYGDATCGTSDHQSLLVMSEGTNKKIF